MLIVKNILWAVACAAGIARLSFSAAAFVRTKKAVHFWSGAFQIALTALLASLSLSGALTAAGSGDFPLFRLSPPAASALLILTLPLYTHYRVGLGKKRLRRMNLFFFLLFLLLCGLLVLGRLSPIKGAEGLLPPLLFSLLAAALIYAAVLERLVSQNLPEPTLAVRVAAAGVTGLVPLFIWVDFFSGHGAGYTVAPLLYTALSLLLFLRDRNIPGTAAPETAAAKEISGQFGLTAREEEVALLLTEGLTYQNIADELFISIQTVKTHANKIYAKTECKNKMELNRVLRRKNGPT